MVPGMLPPERVEGSLVTAEGLVASTSVVHGASGRYASALFELARDANLLDKVEADLKDLRDLLDNNSDFALFCLSSAIDNDKKSNVVGKVGEKAGFQDLTVKFLGHAALRGRLTLLRKMIRDFMTLMDSFRDEAVAEVTSAVALTTAQSDELQAKLKASLGRDVRIEARVQPELLGGMVVQVGSRLIDTSIANQLTQLQRNLKEAR